MGTILGAANMDVKIIKEKDNGNGEAGFKIQFEYTHQDLGKSANQPLKPSIDPNK